MGFAMLQRHRKKPVSEAVEVPVTEPKREPEPEQAPPPKPVGRRRKSKE